MWISHLNAPAGGLSLTVYPALNQLDQQRALFYQDSRVSFNLNTWIEGLNTSRNTYTFIPHFGVTVIRKKHVTYWMITKMKFWATVLISIFSQNYPSLTSWCSLGSWKQENLESFLKVGKYRSKLERLMQYKIIKVFQLRLGLSNFSFLFH